LISVRISVRIRIHFIIVMIWWTGLALWDFLQKHLELLAVRRDVEVEGVVPRQVPRVHLSRGECVSHTCWCAVHTYMCVQHTNARVFDTGAGVSDTNVSVSDRRWKV